MIGGDATDSTSTYATKGTRTAIVLNPGSPVHAAFNFEVSSLWWLAAQRFSRR